MLRMRTPNVLKLGERYVRVNDPETQWTVCRIVALPRLPQHAELVSDGLHRRCVLVSSAALRDRRQYRPVRDSATTASTVEMPGRVRGWRSMFGW